MKKRIIAFLLFLSVALTLDACTGREHDPPFRITFIDVGQGDAALIECDGKYMLIDVGPANKTSADQIYRLLLEKEVRTLQYLVISHLHDDHYGGLTQGALQNVNIKNTLCNEDPYTIDSIGRHIRGSKIIVPEANDTYKLGSASIYIVDVCAEQENDSLVILIEYGKTRFLFTGDIEGKAHSRVAGKLRAMSDKLRVGENLIKMPHHGAYNSDPALPDNASDNSLATLVSESYAKYFVVSVGENNRYGHPHEKTLEIIDQALSSSDLDRETHFFRTDECGNIVFESDGNKIRKE